jgi:membrane protease subunit HflC
MKNIGTIVAAVFLAAVLLLYMCSFQVRFTEVAIVKTWGEPADEALTEPGLYFKWPRPIQSVVVYDKRIRTLELRTEETRTADGKNLVVTTYTRWRIGRQKKDPIEFLTNFPGGVEDGESKLRTSVVTTKHAVIGKREFVEFVTTDPSKRKIREIEREIRDIVARDAREQYGIEVVGFGVKKLGLPQSVTTAIFDSMKAHEEAKAKRYVAEGEARAQDILANARAAENRIMAAAQEKAREIETEAEQVVSTYYKEFDEHPELRIFLDKLRVDEQALRERTTLILSPEKAPWDVFNEEARAKVRPAAKRSDPDAASDSDAPETTSSVKPD